jgi:hypothetical protein
MQGQGRSFTDDSSGLEDLEDLTVDTLPCGCMDGCLDGIHCENRSKHDEAFKRYHKPASNEFSPNCSESFMKSPLVKETWSWRPAF